MDDRVTLKLGDIGTGIDEIGVDALFLDLPNPWDYMPQVRSALKPGGTFACILPTANQVQHFLSVLREHNFAFIEVCETFLRWYKAVADRFRPTDRMVGHTAYLVFARPVLIDEEHVSKELLAEAGLVVNEDLDDELPLEI